jgi:D-alanyl-lipoteichoic acid acyltransferase DltB (MBOAT superfamily)
VFFNSYPFILLFAPVSILAAGLARRCGGTLGGNFALSAFSIGFYSLWEPRHLPVLLGSIAFNALTGAALVRFRTARRPLLAAGIAANLALLGFFKYSGFLAAQTGLPLPVHQGALPLGISFFTLQQIVFLVAIAREEMAPPRLDAYITAVSFYPHLVAGPIVRYRDLVPQFLGERARAVEGAMAASGVALFAIGLGKKVLLADPLAAPVAGIFDAAAAGQPVSAAAAWLAALGYTLQLYFDFSGYSDMAIGLARFFGVRLPINFDSPYRARSIRDFWRRWHMTLSAFLRDYLYIPLGGSRHGTVRTVLNAIATMTIGGLWHGAGWTFILWGAMHGLYIAAAHLWRRFRAPALPALLGWGITVLAVIWAWVPFRADSLAATVTMWSAMLHGSWSPAAAPREFVARVLLGLIIVLALPNSMAMIDPAGAIWRRLLTPAGAVAVGVLLFASVLSIGTVTEFLYFNF